MTINTQVKEHMSRVLKVPVGRLTEEAVLTDLVTDSFVLVDLVIELQEELGVLIMQEDLKGVNTVGDLVRLFESRVGA
ncbi:MAG TPA: acyl carrier protein [Candidatus Obscuribacterales bacterium]